MKTSTSSDAIPDMAAEKGKQKSGDDRGNGKDQAKQTELGQVGADGLFLLARDSRGWPMGKGPLGQERMKDNRSPKWRKGDQGNQA